MYVRGLIPFLPPGYFLWRDTLLALPSPYKELGERVYISSSMEEYDNITRDGVLGQGSI